MRVAHLGVEVQGAEGALTRLDPEDGVTLNDVALKVLVKERAIGDQLHEFVVNLT